MPAHGNSYHDYQKVLDINRKPGRRSTMKPNNRKSKNGCLGCKRRKKKCDEEKPVCRACTRNSLDCKWPEHVLNLVNQRVVIHEHTNQSDRDINANQNTNFVINQVLPEQPLALAELLNPLDDCVSTFNFNDDFILEQFLDMQSENLSGNPDSHTCNTPINEHTFNKELAIPGVEMSEHDILCYNAFVNYSIKSMTYPHCNPSLSPFSIILPFVTNNHIVREVALAFGATLLSYDESCFKDEAIERYNRVINLLIKELSDPNASFTDHVFVSVQLLQALCYRNKNVGFNITLSAGHCSTSYAIIKKRLLRNTLLTCQNDEYPYKVNPLDRLLMEHFVLVYPINIMLCHSSKLSDSVPSPFRFFGRFYHILQEPISGYSRDDTWNSHPVIGVGLKAHAIATKCAWICRFLKVPIPEEDMITYFSLLVETTNELKRLKNLLLDNPTFESSKIENIHLTKTLLYGSLIVLKKLCLYERTTIDSLQGTVNLLIREEKAAREAGPNGVSALWALFVGASTSTTVEQRTFFSGAIKRMADQLRSSICLKMLNYLDVLWDNEVAVEGSGKNVGFEYLFDASMLDTISI